MTIFLEMSFANFCWDWAWDITAGELRIACAVCCERGDVTRHCTLHRDIQPFSREQSSRAADYNVSLVLSFFHYIYNILSSKLDPNSGIRLSTGLSVTRGGVTRESISSLYFLLRKGFQKHFPIFFSFETLPKHPTSSSVSLRTVREAPILSGFGSKRLDLQRGSPTIRQLLSTSGL